MRRLQDIGTTASISTSGATPIVSQIEDVLAGIQSTLSQIITEYNAEVYPVVSSLPQGRDDTRWKMASNAIYPKRNYLDGNNIFVDSTASARVDDGRYWRMDLLRPRTIKESFSQLYTEIQDQIDGLRTSISSYTNEGLTAAQKARIGMNIFDPILPSSASSLDGLTQTHELNFTQVGKDLYGASWSLDGDGLENLYYSVKEMVDALLQIHGGAWDTDVSVFHSSWGTPLSVSDEGVSIDAGVISIDFVGAGITATQASSGHVQVEVTATGLAVEDEGVSIDLATTTIDFVGTSVTATQTAPGSVEIEVTTSYWGAVADTSELPNVAGAAIQDAALAAGDTAYVTADAALYLCITETVGAAAWVLLSTWPRVSEATLDLAQVANTYDALEADGDVLVEGISLYVSEAGADFTSVSVVTNQTSPTTVLTAAEGVVANILLQKNLAFAYSRLPFQLRSGQKLQYVIDGNGTAGEIKMVVVFRPTATGVNVDLV